MAFEEQIGMQPGDGNEDQGGVQSQVEDLESRISAIEAKLGINQGEQEPSTALTKPPSAIAGFKAKPSGGPIPFLGK